MLTTIAVDSTKHTITAITSDKWTAWRWMKAGFPVVHNPHGVRSWRLDLSTESPRLRWTKLCNLAVAKTWWEGKKPKDGRGKSVPPGRGTPAQRALQGSGIEFKTRTAQSHKEGLAGIFEVLNSIPRSTEAIGANPPIAVHAEPDEYDAAMEDLEAYLPDPSDDGEV